MFSFTISGDDFRVTGTSRNLTRLCVDTDVHAHVERGCCVLGLMLYKVCGGWCRGGVSVLKNCCNQRTSLKMSQLASS